MREERRLRELRVNGGDDGDATHSCNVCFDECREADGITCKHLHFLCDGCFGGDVASRAEADDRFATGAEVVCPDPGCTDPFTVKEVLSSVNLRR